MDDTTKNNAYNGPQQHMTGKMQARAEAGALIMRIFGISSFTNISWKLFKHEALGEPFLRANPHLSINKIYKDKSMFLIICDMFLSIISKWKINASLFHDEIRVNLNEYYRVHDILIDGEYEFRNFQSMMDVATIDWTELKRFIQPFISDKKITSFLFWTYLNKSAEKAVLHHTSLQYELSNPARLAKLNQEKMETEPETTDFWLQNLVTEYDYNHLLRIRKLQIDTAPINSSSSLNNQYQQYWSSFRISG